MASEKQRVAARDNIKKAAAAARKKRTIANLPARVRTALGKKAPLPRARSAQDSDVPASRNKAPRQQRIYCWRGALYCTTEA